MPRTPDWRRRRIPGAQWFLDERYQRGSIWSAGKTSGASDDVLRAVAGVEEEDVGGSFADRGEKVGRIGSAEYFEARIFAHQCLQAGAHDP